MSYLGFDYFSSEIVAEIRKSAYVGSVYDYASSTLDVYPAVIVTASSLTGQFADTTRNLDGYIFSILCLMDRHGIESEVENRMQLLVDDIISRLNNNAVVNNNVSTFGKPLHTQWAYATAPEPDMRAVTITYEIDTAQ